MWSIFCPQDLRIKVKLYSACVLLNGVFFFLWIFFIFIPKHDILNYLGGKRIIVSATVDVITNGKKMETDNVK